MAKQKGHIKYKGTLGDVRHFKIKGLPGFYAGLTKWFPAVVAFVQDKEMVVFVAPTLLVGFDVKCLNSKGFKKILQSLF